MTSRPRLTYVGHSYHERTGSTRFLQDLLASQFEVTTIWDESWKPGATPLTAATINATRPEHVVLFQQLPSRAQYAQLRCDNVVWIPMHDGLTYGPHWQRWLPSGMKVLCFCAADYRYFSGLGYPSLRVQYCPPPQASADAVPRRESVFFWLRRNEICWPTLKRLLGSWRPDRIVLRVAADPGHAPELPSADDRAAYRIELHGEWMEASRYRQLLAGCTLFMAPRPREGIGQGLLDARALGLVGIAPNAPTMNEYLRDGENGLLYELAAPAPLNFAGLPQLRAQSLADLATGHSAWQSAAPAVLDFVRRPQERRAPWWWRARSRLPRP